MECGGQAVQACSPGRSGPGRQQQVHSQRVVGQGPPHVRAPGASEAHSSPRQGRAEEVIVLARARAHARRGGRLQKEFEEAGPRDAEQRRTVSHVVETRRSPVFSLKRG